MSHWKKKLCFQHTRPKCCFANIFLIIDIFTFFLYCL